MSDGMRGAHSMTPGGIAAHLIVAGSLLVAAPVLAHAQEDPARFSLTLGAFITDQQTKTRIDSETLGPGTPINLSDTLGFDPTNTVFRVDGYLRFNRRHRIDFSVFDLSRDSVYTIDETLQVGDDIFDIDTTVSASSDLAIYKVDYTWSAIQRDKGFLGLTGGLYIMDTGLSLSEPTLGTAESRAITAPLPVIGFRGEYDMTPRWTLRGSAEFFAVEYQDVDGSLVDLYAGVDFAVTDHFAVGLAYNKVTIDVESADSGFLGIIDWSYQGVLLGLRFDFGSVR